MAGLATTIRKQFGVSTVQHLGLSYVQAWLAARRAEVGNKEQMLETSRAQQSDREAQRLFALQTGEAGYANRSGSHFDIVLLTYHNSTGGRDLKLQARDVCR